MRMVLDNMPIRSYYQLSDVQKEKLPTLFEKNPDDPSIFYYSIDEDTGDIVARLPFKLSDCEKFYENSES